MSYMTDKFKGKYRLRTEYDLFTNDFPKDLKGAYSDVDIYIDCQSKIRIFYYGHGILNCYIPSLGKGHNIVKNIFTELCKADIMQYSSENGRDSKTGELRYILDYHELYKDSILNTIIFDIVDTDSEVEFKFKIDKMDLLEPYLKPRTSGANISPFSSRNLPKSTFTVPDEAIAQYKAIISTLDKSLVLKLGFITNAYIKSLATKKNPIENIKSDMKMKRVKGKEYIYIINKWEPYLKYLKAEIQKLIDTN